MANYVYTLGDSIHDNIWWGLNDKGSNLEEAKKKSVEGQLQEKLNKNSNDQYTVISHAYDGFTTSSVLYGDSVGGVLGKDNDKMKVYLNYKASVYYQKPTVYPLNLLKKSVENAEKRSLNTHYVALSVGGNDFREKLGNPLQLLAEVSKMQERYFQILKNIKEMLPGAKIRPILTFVYQLDANDDRYGIYSILKIVGAAAFAIHSLSIAGIAASAISVIAHKTNIRSGIIIATLSAAILFLSTRIIPFKVTKGILKGQNISMTTLGALMEIVYRPILVQAKKDRIPILDLPNTFNPYKNLYTCQIEPNEEGGALIATGLDYIIKNHNFESESKIYKSNSDTDYSGSENPGSKWEVAYPKK